MSDYVTRKQKEIDHFREVEVRHKKMPAATEFWRKRYLRPKLEAVGLESLESLYFDPIASRCEAKPDELIQIVSLGAGTCAHEVRLATQLRARGFRNFHIDCLEINGDLLGRGRQIASESEVIENLGFVETDVNGWDAEQRYSVCLAIQALHHFQELETVLTKVRHALTPSGQFVVNDMIGRNGHRRWPEALYYIQEIWSQMSERYKYQHMLRRFDAEYPDRDWSQKTFEGIRSQDILPLLIDIFDFELFVAVRNVIDPFISRGYGPNFDMEREDDREFITRISELDERLIGVGIVKPTQLVAWLRKEPVPKTKCFSHWTPEHCVRRPDAEQDSGAFEGSRSAVTVLGTKPVRRKKIAFYGNCHAPALTQMLQASNSFKRQFNVVRLPAVHAIAKKRHESFLDEIAPELDVLVHQPIRGHYRGSEVFGAEYVKSRIPGEAVTISFPSLQFFGYYPRSNLCRKVTREVDAFSRQEFGPPGRELLHYDQVIRSYLMGRDVPEAVYAFDEGETNDAARAVTRMEQTLDYMRSVEAEFAIDIPMSSFIAENFADRMLFHTPRHPCTEVLFRVARRILELLSVEATHDEVECMQRLEPLAFCEYPLQNYVTRALNLRFPAPTAFRSSTNFMNKAEMIEKYYALYDLFTPAMWQTMSTKFPRLVAELKPSPVTA